MLDIVLWQISEGVADDDDDFMSIGSDSLVDESSSDGYTPYVSRRGGGGRSRKKKQVSCWCVGGFYVLCA